MSQAEDLFGAAEPATQPQASQPQPATPAAKTPSAAAAAGSYSASDIEVLEGLEPVRRRPGMYIGGTDTNALHHLFAEVIDNSMDEAIAGHATRIEVHLGTDGYVTVTDNGRGIPVEPHPKQPEISTLELVLTKLHAGGKFDSKAYETSGGLHGVGVSVVNALSDDLTVEVARDQMLYRQSYSRGKPVTALETVGRVNNRRGTTTRFHPDAQIFGDAAHFSAARLFRMTRAKAYLFAGVELRWSCDEELASDDAPAKAVFHYPNGLKDFMLARIEGETRIVDDLFAGSHGKPGTHGAVEWAISWTLGDGGMSSYCNTVPTRDGGTHEAGLRTALLRGLKGYAELTKNKAAANLTAEDIFAHCNTMLSVFVREPEFVGQTKDKLASGEATRIVDSAVRDAFDHWLAASPNQAGKLLDWAVERAEERLRRRKEKEIDRASATRKLRLPGKLADCTQTAAQGAELFIVEGDSAGGSAKQARSRASQAVLPLRGKILNVAGASREKMAASQLISDMIQALGCGTRDRYREEDLRYDKIIIMTDADVDGAHIAALLMTFFFQEMPKLIDGGHLFLAMPPLYRISQGGKTLYARDDEHRAELMATEFTGKGKIDTTRFKGLGEMPFAHLRETTMSVKSRTLLQVKVRDDLDATRISVDRLMGTKPEARFDFIQENAAFVTDLDI
ncbi:DNA topoisomerase IV subunit B [Devosia neptuniae]|jgi:topoisomerase-4 subunit B|uniref:DNA topoisomerase IV subunit B n=1 Tax=Devosia TaxID=46913 RepID=UPI0022AF02EB|nr:DNA topoisomerase IV subunit B [Devosia neptuniae]MCZ4345263.1 DNA topoisomerase IV subunit B [Devosia neptuniae]|tara:strand:+ start:4509 stop:6542 length:2034 start_codon:yes stop_codon:yes gene_type:complete